MSSRLADEDPYSPRPIQMHRLLHLRGWTLKLYGISHGQPSVDADLLTAAATAAEVSLPPVTQAAVFGFGFVIAHHGQHAQWALVDWWQEGGVLAQQLLSRPIGDRAPLAPTTGHLMACVWEMSVQGFERDAWVRYVLSQPSRPDVDAYLGTSLSVESHLPRS